MTLPTALMQEHIHLIGAPQVVCTRAFAYRWLQECGYDPAARGMGSLEFLIFHAPEVAAPLSDLRAWESFLDGVQIELGGRCIVQAVGFRYLPRLLSCERHVLTLAELGGTLTREGVDWWLQEHSRLHTLRDFAAAGPGVQIGWQDTEWRDVWADSLGAAE